MTTVLITGANGFIGKNLVLHLSYQKDLRIISYDVGTDEAVLDEGLKSADFIFHLAGINRPADPADFKKGNFDFTHDLLRRLADINRTPAIIATSSTQAVLDNPYGISKHQAEVDLLDFQSKTGSKVMIFRLTNVFGKFCKPFYNSVVATYCYQATHGEELQVNDPSRVIDFIYVDDIVRTFVGIIRGESPVYIDTFAVIQPSYTILLGDLARKVNLFRENREKGLIPDFYNQFDKYLYSTFLSYLDKDNFGYVSTKNQDQRGYLFELIKSEHSGQVFVSRTLPGITRGNHFHHTKIEKFCVVDGKALIAFRHAITQEKVEYLIEGTECRILDIPPGWTHSITNIGDTDLITIFWANEIFDPSRPDTYFAEV